MEKTWIHEPGQSITKNSGQQRPGPVSFIGLTIHCRPSPCSHGDTHTKAFQNSPLDIQDLPNVHLRTSNKTKISPPTELKQP